MVFEVSNAIVQMVRTVNQGHCIHLNTSLVHIGCKRKAVAYKFYGWLIALCGWLAGWLKPA